MGKLTVSRDTAEGVPSTSELRSSVRDKRLMTLPNVVKNLG